MKRICEHESASSHPDEADDLPLHQLNWQVRRGFFRLRGGGGSGVDVIKCEINLILMSFYF
jgi:hypothetical protein